MQILSFVWDPSPGIDLGFFIIRYYSLMFVIAFSVGWILTKKIYKNEGQPADLRFCIFFLLKSNQLKRRLQTLNYNIL